MTAVPASEGTARTDEVVTTRTDEAVATRTRRRLPVAYLVAAGILPLILLALLAWRLLAAPAAPPATIGSAAPNFTLTDLSGKPVSLASLHGHPVMVNFWASWCTPCIEEFPLLQQAEREHAADGLVIVGIVYQDTADRASAFMSRMGAGWATAMDPGGSVASSYGIYAPPDTFFIDSSGVIRGRQIGQLSEQDLARQLDTILGKE